jgi:thiol:disulfide interchange protein
MKKFKIVFFFTIITFGLFAQNKTKTTGVLFETGTLGQALEKAASGKKNVPKLVFVDCYATWCGPCMYMTNTVFPMENIGAFFNINFVSIKIDYYTTLVEQLKKVPLENKNKLSFIF